MEKIYAFGQPVPVGFIEEMLEEGYKKEDITPELIEAVMYYDFLDDGDN